MQECQPVISPITLVQHDVRETNAGYEYKCLKCGREGCCGNDVNFPDYEVDLYFEDLLQQEDKQFLGAVDNISELSDKQKLLLPCRVYGFALRTRKWATFDIDLVKDIEYADSWDNLVINKTVKETVLALVKNHSRNPEQIHSLEGALSSVDLVRGKGKGLIILLHGEPGVGKTSTAECVADHTRRPLFPITCGDIGDTAVSVEDNLEKNFQLAHKWGCVLLLDEAE
jgi:ATPase family associated with various cellular activities (AAA)